MKKRVLLSWSSGKDSAWTLYKLQEDAECEVTGLFCTVNAEFKRVAMHAVRVELLQQQAASCGLPLEIIDLPWPCSNAAYEELMGQFVQRSKEADIDSFAFGDLFLDDVRRYREDRLKDSGISAIFPLWGRATDKLARDMIAAGLRAVITCIDPNQIAEEFAGREFDADLLNSLPANVDPCGENGEFHSFVYDGPMFKEQIQIETGRIIRRDDFVFADLLPKTG